MRLGVLATHPIQYHAPLYRELAQRLDLQVYFAHRQTPEGQAAAGFGVEFEWDVPLLDGYDHTFLHNRSRVPDVSTSHGCDTPEIAGIIERERFDAFLVNGWYNRSYRQAIRACWRTKTPLMVRGDSHLLTPRSKAKQLLKEGLFRFLIPRFDRYLVVGQRSREYYLHYGADAARMRFVPHFVDNAWFRARAAAEDPSALRATLGLDQETLIALFIGKFIAEKKPQDLIRAAHRLREHGRPVQVVLVGAGELEEFLRGECARLDIPATFAGFKNQSELPYYYVGSDVLVLPSDGGETWGLVVNEAMACGRPAVVAETVGCAPDLVENDLTGYAYPPGDVVALADVLAQAFQLRHAPGLRVALDQKMAIYSLETAADGILGAVQEFAARASGVEPASLAPAI
jgi:glycosyltransferase involved in cell wall biosynthesis